MGSMNKAAAAGMLALATVLGGCQSGIGAGDVPRAQVGQVGRVDEGTVVSVRPVRVENERTIVGPATGAAIGGIAGSQYGGGDEERAIAAIAGAVLGGIVGGAVDRGVTTRQGYGYIVRRQRDGQLITVVQGADLQIAPGTPVFIEYLGDRARIVPR